jgi:hypothetical protein
MNTKFNDYLEALRTGQETEEAWRLYLGSIIGCVTKRSIQEPAIERPHRVAPTGCAHLLESYPEVVYCNAPVTRKSRCEEHAKRLPFWPS